MRLIAEQAFYYGDKHLKVGDAFLSSSDEDARILKGVGRAKDAPLEQLAVEPAGYQTRAVEAGETATNDAAPRGRTRRSYSRRDMRAED